MSKVIAGARAGWMRHEPIAKVVGLALAAVCLVAVLWWVPRYQVAHTPGVTGEKRFESEDEARKTLAQMLGGAVVLLGLYFSAKTFGLSREGQLTDRYTKAIEQLGKSDGGQPNIEVRLGAIYALERIAVDSPRDHWTIMEVLTAYVRRNAPVDPWQEYRGNELPRTEIQAILTVLGRRRIGGGGREESLQRLNLSRSRLCNADLSDGNFEGAGLSFADLRGASLARTNLQGARLWNANLQRANLLEANLRGAKCFQADFREANLPKADLRGAELTGGRFEGAKLATVNLQSAEMTGAKLNDADGLTAAQVTQAKGWEKAMYSPRLHGELGLSAADGAAAEDAAKGRL